MTNTNTDRSDNAYLEHQQAEYADHRVAEVFGDLSPDIGPDGVDYNAGSAHQAAEFRDFLLEQTEDQG